MAMNCEAFKEQIDLYIDGELESAACAEMEKHAETCAPCMKLLEEARTLQEMLSEMSEAAVPLPAQAAWRRAVREEAKVKRRPAVAWLRSVASVAAAMVVLAAGTIGMRMGESIPAAGGDFAALTTRETGYAARQDRTGEGEEQTSVLPIGYAAGTLQSDGSLDTETRATGGMTQTQPVVLRSAERAIESANYDSDVQWLNDLVSEYGAYFEEREEVFGEQGGSGRISKAVIRVPSDRLDDFLMELDQLGTTVRRSEAAEDVTGRYMDKQSRLDALTLQKEKLTQMLTESTDIEALIAIDDKMAEVIAQMESLEGDLRRWESQQSYSKVTLTIAETAEGQQETQQALGVRMQKGYEEALVWLKEFGQDALVMLATYGPRLVILIPVLILGAAAGWLLRRRKR